MIGDPDGLKLAIDSLDGLLEGVDYDVIAGAESRGFIFGTPLAYKNGKGFALVRKRASCLERRLRHPMIWNTEVLR